MGPGRALRPTRPIRKTQSMLEGSMFGGGASATAHHNGLVMPLLFSPIHNLQPQSEVRKQVDCNSATYIVLQYHPPS